MSVTVYPASDADDLYCDLSGCIVVDYLLYTSRPLYENYRVAYVRFPNVTMAQGVVLESANLTLTNKGTGGDNNFDVAVHLWANDIDNSIAPTNYSEFTAMAYTTAYTSSVTLLRTADGTQTTVSVLTPVQEVINRAGWASGNAIGIIFRVTHLGGSIHYDAYDYGDGNASYYPKLVLNQAALTISDFTPTSGPFGTRVTLTGTGYSTTTTDNTVKIGGVACNVVSSTTTEIVFSVHPQAISGTITVDRTGYVQGVSSGSYTMSYTPRMIEIR